MFGFVNYLPGTLVITDEHLNVVTSKIAPPFLTTRLGQLSQGDAIQPLLNSPLIGLSSEVKDWAFRGAIEAQEGHLIDVEIACSGFTYNDQVHFSFSIRSQSNASDSATKVSQADSLMRTVIDESPDVIVVKNWEGNFILANKTVANLYKTTPEAMIGREDGYFTGNFEQAAFFRKNVQDVMRRFETEVVYEKSTNAQTGEVRHFQSIKKPLLNPLGEKQILVIAHDITDIVRARESIEQSERQLKYVMDATLEGIWDWGIPEGSLTHNDRWSEILGLDKDQLDQTIEDFVSLLYPEDKPQIMQKIQACLQGETEHYYSEHRMLKADGSITWVLDRGKVVERGENGEPVRMVGSFTEINQRKQDELALKQAIKKADQANRAKSLFLANMSHEIRTPLNGILGLVEQLLDTPLSEQQSRNLQMVLNSSEHLMVIINDILDLAKIESGKAQLEVIDFSLVEVLQKTLGLMRASAELKGLALSLEIAPGLEWVKGDAHKIQQIITNLLGNAIKFTEQGSVTIRAYLVQQSLRMEVNDTGCGISQHDSQSLFEAFKQVDASTTRRYGGTGLGLSICKKLTELMAGQIGVNSEVGQGSTFWIEIPYQAGRVQQSPRNIQVATEQIDLQGINVLLVEDNLVNQKVAQAYLKKLGIDSVLADNGQRALDVLEKQSFDLILMDCQMPVMDGITASKAIRSGAVGKKAQQTPIVALTANVLEEEEQACYEAGMVGFVSKPIKIATLAQEISKALMD